MNNYAIIRRAIRPEKGADESGPPDQEAASGSSLTRGASINGGQRLWLRRIASLAGRHRAFTSLLLVAALLRVIVIVAYVPAIWFNDAFEYVAVALHTDAYPVRPDGYSFVLKALEPFHSFALVVILQHMLGLAMGVGIYALGRRLGLMAWVACLAAAPMLLDAYEIQLEHMPLSDTLFTSLLLLAMGLAVKRSVGLYASIAAGLLCAAAMLTRPAALPVVAVIAVYLICRRIGWRRLLGFTGALLIPIAIYASWYHAEHGAFAIDSSTGIQLYGRVAGFADCQKIHPPAKLRPLCPRVPGTRLPAPYWVWSGTSPLYSIPGYTFSPKKEALARSFALRAILEQPLDYASVVKHDVLGLFAWRRGGYPNSYTASGYQFTKSPWPIPAAKSTLGGARQNLEQYGRVTPDTKVLQPWANILIEYQKVVYVRGPLWAAMFLLALLGLIPRNRPGSADSRAPLALALCIALGLVFVPIFTVQLDYRYVMPGLAFLPLAAGLGGLRLWAYYRRDPATKGRDFGPAGGHRIPIDPHTPGVT